jgi:hypothetical protein
MIRRPEEISARGESVHIQFRIKGREHRHLSPSGAEMGVLSREQVRPPMRRPPSGEQRSLPPEGVPKSRGGIRIPFDDDQLFEDESGGV